MTDTITTPARAEPITPPASGAQPQDGKTRIEVYTDGSCIGNPGYGGFGFVLLRRDASGKIIKTVEGSGHAVEITTNIRMELTAACAALEALGRVTGEPIAVLCDANLIPNAMNGWLAKWKAKDWKKSDGKLVENRDLWERLERAAAMRNVRWQWVRGHNGTEHNELADKLAYAAARKAERTIKSR